MQNTAYSFTDFTLGSAQHVIKRYSGKPARIYYAHLPEDQPPEFDLMVVEARRKEASKISLELNEEDSKYFLFMDRVPFSAFLVDERGDEIVLKLRSYFDDNYVIAILLFSPQDVPQVS